MAGEHLKPDFLKVRLNLYDLTFCDKETTIRIKYSILCGVRNNQMGLPLLGLVGSIKYFLIIIISSYIGNTLSYWFKVDAINGDCVKILNKN